jgi:lysine biosynthesis protein LysW
MNEQVTTQGGKFECLECRNEVTLDPGKKVGDVIECPFCGIEYEVVTKDEQEATLQIIEEEK